MNRYKLVVVITCVLAFACSTWARSGVRQKIDWLKPLTLKSGEDKFSVRLSSNPTTGYMWVLRHWPKWIEPKGHKYTEDKHKPGMVGVGGRDVWFFKMKHPSAKVPLMGRICWRYTRAWTGAGRDTCQYIVSTPR